MKYNPRHIMKILRMPSLLPRVRFKFNAAGMGAGMGLGVVLVSVVPQFALAGDKTSGSRQQLRPLRNDEWRLKSADDVQKNNEVTLAAVESTKTSPRLAEVVTAVPKLNEKRLSPEELRELRRQLLQQR